MQKQNDKKRILPKILKNPGNYLCNLDNLENFEVDLRYYLFLSRPKTHQRKTEISG
jgi:hypothetical protein